MGRDDVYAEMSSPWENYRGLQIRDGELWMTEFDGFMRKATLTMLKHDVRTVRSSTALTGERIEFYRVNGTVPAAFFRRIYPLDLNADPWFEWVTGLQANGKESEWLLWPSQAN